MARLDRAPRLREVAQLGSVLGREFAYDMIRALAGIEEQTCCRAVSVSWWLTNCSTSVAARRARVTCSSMR